MKIGIGIGLCFGGRPLKTAGVLSQQVGLPLLFVPELMLPYFSLLFGDVVTDAGGFETGATSINGMPTLIGRAQIPSLSLLLHANGLELDASPREWAGFPTLLGRYQIPSLMLSLLYGDAIAEAGGFESGATSINSMPSLIGRAQIPSLSLLLHSNGLELDANPAAWAGLPSLIGRTQIPSLSLLLLSGEYGF